MKLSVVAIALLVSAAPAGADDIDCGSFPNPPARLSCYAAVSRGPKADIVSPAGRPPIDRPGSKTPPRAKRRLT